MQAKDIMSRNPACCSPDTSLQDAAKMMAEHDCGEVPVLNQAGHPIGVVTDRDIACRAVAQGKGPGSPVSDVMSTPAVTVTPEDSIDDCCKTLEQNQIRRVPVVDTNGTCCGMVSQADIALHAPENEIAAVVRDVSRPTTAASRVGCC